MVKVYQIAPVLQKTCKILKLDGLYLSNLDSPPQGDAKKHAFKLHVPDTFNKRRQVKFASFS